VGRVVKVTVKGSIKEGVILDEVKKPKFETLNILEISDLYLSKEQMELVKFISSYYFSPIGKTLSLFYPYQDRKEPQPDPQELVNKNLKSLPKLTKEQMEALKRIEKEDISLLFGVTGSGKTEIYIHLIEDALKRGEKALILMPEISLTPQITDRLKRYFGNLVITWHSKIGVKRRRENLNMVRDGRARVIIGARSAIFLPIDNLGITIIDEEHDDSYKSSSKPSYNAKDLAIYMGRKFKIKTLLGSATPLVASYYRFSVVRLKKPYIKAKKRFLFTDGEELNDKLIEYIKDTVSRGNQVLIFIPTRGNFKYMICGDCGKPQLCPYCSIGMSLYADKRLLKCHYCSFAKRIPDSCDFCNSSNFILKREGVAEVVKKLEESIPNGKIIQIDRDSITSIKKLEKALKKIRDKEANIIVGTQMLSKGHDYPDIALSIIMGLDFLLAIGDFRAKERAVAMMHQVAGRSGRRGDATVIIQTAQADFFIPYVQDYEKFLVDELKFREIANYPPFSYLARVIISERDFKRGEKKLESALERLKEFNNIEIVGSGNSPIKRISNRWRFFILVRASKRVELLKAMHSIYTLGVDIDMDPIDFS